MKDFYGILLRCCLIMALLASCETELDFQYHDVDSQFVIEGSTSEEGTSVKLTYTCPMAEPMLTTPVTEAAVRLIDLTDNVERELQIDAEGIFRDSSPGIAGHEYELKVSHDGSSYSSTCEMKQAADIIGLEFQWIKMPYDHVAVLQISFRDLPSADDRYWIRIYRNGEPYTWLLSGDTGSPGGVIKEVTMTSRKDIGEEDEKSVLRDGDEVSVVVAPVSRLMYDYIVSLQADSNGLRMFAGDFCLGYYLASSLTRASIIFHPDTIPVAD